MRTTPTANELSIDEMREGGRKLTAKVRRYKPGFLAVLGVGAYRAGFGQPKAQVGLQDHMIGKTKVWVLPNPSGLNAHYQADELARLFRELKTAVDASVTMRVSTISTE